MVRDQGHIQVSPTDNVSRTASCSRATSDFTCNRNAITKYWYLATKSPAEVNALTWQRRLYHRLFVWPDFQYFQIRDITCRLYEEMYTRLAKGDVDPMRGRLCASMYDSLTNRIHARPPKTKFEWQRHRYIGWPRVVSHKVMLMSADVGDGTKATMIQQAVVRIRSEQSLRRVRRVVASDGTMTEELEKGSVGGGQRGKEVVEYVVVQRSTRKGVAGEWMLWGTTEPTTLDKVEAKEKALKGES